MKRGFEACQKVNPHDWTSEKKARGDGIFFAAASRARTFDGLRESEPKARTLLVHEKFLETLHWVLFVKHLKRESRYPSLRCTQMFGGGRIWKRGKGGHRRRKVSDDQDFFPLRLLSTAKIFKKHLLWQRLGG